MSTETPSPTSPTVIGHGSLNIAFADGVRPRLAFAYREAPGLAVACLPLSETDPTPAYSITHRKSGRKVAPDYFASLREAEAVLLRLAPLMDWTQPGEALLEELARRGTAFHDRLLAACRGI